MSAPLDPYAVPDQLATRFLQVQEMANALQEPGSREFFVMLTQYFIEGEAYRASALTVSPTATPNLVQTQTGFVCDAFFAPDLLSPAATHAGKAEDGRIRVRLEARLEDIIQIVATG